MLIIIMHVCACAGFTFECLSDQCINEEMLANSMGGSRLRRATVVTTFTHKKSGPACIATYWKILHLICTERDKFKFRLKVLATVNN